MTTPEEMAGKRAADERRCVLCGDGMYGAEGFECKACKPARQYTPKERQIERLSASMAHDLIEVVKIARASSTPDTVSLARLVAKVHVKVALLDLTKALPARLFR